MLPYDVDRRPLTRLRRFLRPRPYKDRLPPGLVAEVIQRRNKSDSRFIFLNGVELAELACSLREQLDTATARLVLFSFGLESVDYLHRARADLSLHTRRATQTLGRQIAAESHQRQCLDYVFTMAPFEAEIERWLGAKQVEWLPRTVPAGNRLDWQPDPNRIGCVGTWDHPPNAEGLILFLEAFDRIAPPEVRFRLVGGPAHSGRVIAERNPHVDYLGTLSDQALKQEASTWSCFVHPIFCYARGASTKLAVALGWQIPVVTTRAGARGYQWREGTIPTVETPDELARLALTMLEPMIARTARDQTSLVAASSPGLKDVAAMVRKVLLAPDKSEG
jgi:hypothetical protein